MSRLGNWRFGQICGRAWSTGRAVLTAFPKKTNIWTVKRAKQLGPMAGVCALALALTGTSAAGSRDAPTIASSAPIVTYGESVVLSGVAPGQAVSLLSQACGFTDPAPSAKVSVDPTGAFRLSLAPAISTLFLVEADGVTSRAIRVVVRPAVAVTRLQPGRYGVSVSAGAGSFFTGSKVLLQAKVKSRWSTIAHAVLAKHSAETALTAVSYALVRARVAAGSLVRAQLPSTEVAPCFAGSTSQTLTG